MLCQMKQSGSGLHCSDRWWRPKQRCDEVWVGGMHLTNWLLLVLTCGGGGGGGGSGGGGSGEAAADVALKAAAQSFIHSR
jgi:hypothetical protein